MPPTVYVDEPIPNNRTMVADGNKHSFAFSFADFLEIWLKSFGWKTAIDIIVSQILQSHRRHHTFTGTSKLTLTCKIGGVPL